MIHGIVYVGMLSRKKRDFQDLRILKLKSRDHGNLEILRFMEVESM